jgi:hypothetical protein
LGWRDTVRSSWRPWANWHFSAYLQEPLSWYGRHSSVLYRLVLASCCCCWGGVGVVERRSFLSGMTMEEEEDDEETSSRSSKPLFCWPMLPMLLLLLLGKNLKRWMSPSSLW